jgi:hypothetical protein
MPSVGLKWELAPDAEASAARWLGIFRRAIPLKLSTPSLLTIPIARSTTPQCLSCDTLTSQAAILVSETTLSAAQCILAGKLAPSTAEGGTVALVGVLADEEPSRPPFDVDTPENRLWEQLKLGGPDDIPGEEQVSLAKRLAYLLQPPTDLLISPFGPLEWHGTLFPYQLEGVQALLSRDALLLADDMGLGKTVQAVAALRVLAVQRRMEAALVIVRASLLAQWRREIRTWAPELRTSTVHGPAAERAYQWSAAAHVYLTTYETLRSDLTNNPASPPRRRNWDVVILD